MSVPDKFAQVYQEFTNDLYTTFPELKEVPLGTTEEVYAYCLELYPKVFFEVLYENETFFEVPRFMLPNIDFKTLMDDKITDKTKKTIWKYLQLILFAVLEQVENKDSFGDTSKLFEAIHQEDLHKKIMETMGEMKDLFTPQDVSGEGVSGSPFEDPEKIKSHLEGLMDGKIGSLAKEIAMEATKELGDVEDKDEFMKQLMKNPTKIMELVKNIGTTLETKIKKGDLKESELLEEAAEIMKKMTMMPGMKEMMSKMGMGGKMDFKGMSNKIQENIKITKTKERLQRKREERAATKPEGRDAKPQGTTAGPEPIITEKSADTFIVDVDGSKPAKSKGKKKKNKK
jgi:hypothetical protein